MKKDKYIIWGSAGHAKVLNSIILQQNGEVVALFDNHPDSVTAIDGVALYIGEAGFKEWLAKTPNPQDYFGLVAIGGPRGSDRLKIKHMFEKHKIKTPNIIHPQASVCENVKLGVGTQILAQAIVSADAVLGDSCIINHRASVDHECILGNGVHLAPSSTLCGCVELGDNVFVAAGATILPRIKVGANSIIGAGSLVTKDIPEGVVAYGVPAVIVRKI